MSQQTQALLDSILTNIDHGIIVSNADNIIVHVNPAFERMTGYGASEVVGKDPEILVSGDLNMAIISTIKKSLNSESSVTEEIMIRHSNGKTCLFHSSMHTSQEQSDNYVTILRSITDSNQPDENEEDNAQHDELTGLPNQHLFKDRLEQGLVASKRINKSIATLILGIDRFNIINDGLGYTVGNLLLKSVAARLQECFRESDTVAHIEGDRFGMVLQMTATNDGVTVAEKILKAIKQPFIIEEQEVTLTASIGISLFPTDSENIDQLIKYAESAMHHAKQQGGNHYLFFSNDMNTKAKKRIQMESGLRRALAQDEFVLYYQPKVDADSQQIVGAEALMRWQDPDKGMISPADFIPTAEESGLIVPIGLWGLRETCRQNKQW
jgi:diguanylate cyclase (GGDEF)-like protein/PAS domain S-box-containing protein